MRADCGSSKKYQAIFEPRCNCVACWEKWFFTNPGKVQVAKAGMSVLGRDAVIKVRGTKYVKFLEGFIAKHQHLFNEAEDAV
jgi:hypothetical protein